MAVQVFLNPLAQAYDHSLKSCGPINRESHLDSYLTNCVISYMFLIASCSYFKAIIMRQKPYYFAFKQS